MTASSNGVGEQESLLRESPTSLRGPEKTEKSVITANVEVEANRFGSVYSVTISLRQCGKRMYKVLHGMVHYFKLRVPPYISRYFIAVTELNKMLLYFFLHALLGWR